MKDAGGFANSDAGNGGGHEKDVAFVERRHEFLAELSKREDGHADDDQRADEREPAKAKNEVHERLVGPDQETVDGVLDFGRNFAANEQEHQDRDQGDAEQRGKKHGKSFRKGQRLE